MTNPDLDPIYVNNGSVSVRILDSEGVEVMAPLTMPYISNSDGRYSVAVQPIAGLVDGEIYSIEYYYSEPSGLEGTCTTKKKAAYVNCKGSPL